MMGLAFARRWVSDRGDRLFLNAFALLGAFVGLANAAIAWKLYGTDGDADVWMLALAISQSLCLLSQLGVEQVAVFSSEAHVGDAEAGHRFDHDSMTWAILFGVVFAGLLAVFQPQVIALFARGYSAAQRERLGMALLPLLLQVCCTPGLYVLRQQLLLNGHERISIISNNIFGFAQFAVLGVAWASGGTGPAVLALAVGGVSFAASAMLMITCSEGGMARRAPHWRGLWPFIRASVAMRSTHSIHNFLVVVLTSNALSGGVQGTVALFQYVKKIADGLSSISVGPHLSVYHAMQSKAWALADRRRFVANIRSYLLSAFPLLMLVSAAFAVCAWIALCVTGARGDRFGYTAFAILFVLLAWQTLISVETIAVGVPVMAKKTSVVLVVNGVFVANFYLVIHHVLVAPYTGLAVAVACIACQGVSTVMFTLVAVRLTRIKFGR